MESNCLTRALDQWNDDRACYCLWYNGEHVIALEPQYVASDMTLLLLDTRQTYLELEFYGPFHFIATFKPSPRYLRLLSEYFNRNELIYKEVLKKRRRCIDTE